MTGWAILSNRSELWRLAAPIGLGGAVTLTVGFLLHADHRRAARPDELPTRANPDRDTLAGYGAQDSYDAFSFEDGDSLVQMPRLHLSSFSDYPVA